MEEITIEQEIEIILTKSAATFEGVSESDLMILSIPEVGV